MDASQPSFYHIGDPLQNLNLQVTLKCVHGGKVKKEEEGGGVECEFGEGGGVNPNRGGLRDLRGT